MITKFKSSKYSITKPKTTFERMQTHFKLAPAKKNGCAAVTVPAPSTNTNTMAPQTQATIVINPNPIHHSSDPTVDELYARIINPNPNASTQGTDSAVEELYARIVTPTSNGGKPGTDQDDYAKINSTYSFKPINPAQEMVQQNVNNQQQMLRHSPSPAPSPSPQPQSHYANTQRQYAQMYQQQQQQHQQQHQQQQQQRQSPYQFAPPVVPAPNQFDMGVGVSEIKFTSVCPSKQQPQPQGQPQLQPQGQPMMYQFGTNQYFTPMPATAFAQSSTMSSVRGEMANNNNITNINATQSVPAVNSLPVSIVSSLPHSVLSTLSMMGNNHHPSSPSVQQPQPVMENGVAYVPSAEISTHQMQRNNGFFVPTFTSTDLMNELFSPTVLPASPAPAMEMFNFGNVTSTPPCTALEVINLPTGLNQQPQSPQVTLLNQCNEKKPTPTIMMALQAHSSKLCQPLPATTTTATTTTTSTAPKETQTAAPLPTTNTTKFDPFNYNQTDNLENLFDLPEYECPLFAQQRRISLLPPLPFEDEQIPDVLDELKEYLRKRERDEPGQNSISDDELNFFARKRRKSVCNEQIGQFLLGNPLFNEIVTPFDPSML